MKQSVIPTGNSPLDPRTNKRHAGLAGASLFAVLVIAYHLNGDIFPGHDTLVSMLQAESLVREGNPSFSATEAASLLDWKFKSGAICEPVRITYFDEHLNELYRQGRLAPALNQQRVDSIVPTQRPDVYVNTFPPGAAIVAAPVFAFFELGDHPLSDQPLRFWFVGKLVASLCVAGSAVYVFRIALRFVELRWALLIAAVYGLATGVWSISSQALWQHGPNELFLALATYHLTRIEDGLRHAAWCGFGYAAATCCRPTGALVVVAVAVYLFVYQRRAFAIYLLAGLPLALALAAYNNHFFGSPVRFGQTALATAALRKTGNPAIWQTPPWRGLPGVLFSPSRGLFVYSPILLVALAGYWWVWRQAKYHTLRPLVVAVVAIWCVEASHYDWWSGWSFGYRHLVDTVPLLILGLIPLAPIIASRPWLSVTCGMLLAWSVGVQVLGAWAYEAEGWNARAGFIVTFPDRLDPRLTFDAEQANRWHDQFGARVEPVEANVDDPRFRDRLWSIRDSQLVYYMRHFSEARAFRRRINRLMPHLRTGPLAESHLEIAQLQRRAEDRADAIESVRRALTYDPANRAAQALLGELTE